MEQEERQLQLQVHSFVHLPAIFLPPYSSRHISSAIVLPPYSPTTFPPLAIHLTCQLREAEEEHERAEAELRQTTAQQVLVRGRVLLLSRVVFMPGQELLAAEEEKFWQEQLATLLQVCMLTVHTLNPEPVQRTRTNCVVVS